MYITTVVKSIVNDLKYLQCSTMQYNAVQTVQFSRIIKKDIRVGGLMCYEQIEIVSIKTVKLYYPQQISGNNLSTTME